MRHSYTVGSLSEPEVRAAWHEQLLDWFADALAGLAEANAMQVATVDPCGDPAVRTVLARGIGADGITFFTNYDSAKGQQLRANPRAAALFSWLPLERQVRLTGPVRQVPRAETEAYFATRPRGSQLAAWASPQSSVVADRAELDGLMDAVAARFGDAAIPAPPGWGGYRLAPDSVEFWQGRANRLHDRLRYRREGEAWVVERLAP